MGRHRKPSKFPRRTAVTVAVVAAGGLSVSSSGAWSAPLPARSVESSTPQGLPAVPRIEVSTPQPSPTPVQVSSAPPAPAPQSVIVGSGDTLASIARRYGQTWQELWRRNLAEVPDPNRLRLGQTLSLVAPLAALPTPPPLPAPASSPSPTAASEPVAEPVREESAAPSGIVGIARTFTGIPYRWGGKSRSGVDCSGLVYLVLKKAGLTDTYRTSAALRDWVRQIPRAEARPGDLVFGPGHVGIYIGNGRMIDAPRTGTVVQERSVHNGMYFYGRIPT